MLFRIPNRVVKLTLLNLCLPFADVPWSALCPVISIFYLCQHYYHTNFIFLTRFSTFAPSPGVGGYPRSTKGEEGEMNEEDDLWQAGVGHAYMHAAVGLL